MSDTPAEKYSIVLVIRPFSHHADAQYNNIDRFLDIGMVTYEKFLNKEDLQEFFVIVPKADVTSVQKRLQDAYPSWPWRVINEDNLLHASIPPGWARQQTVKLAVSALVRTPTYLIIDDDTYLTKPLSISDMRDPTSGKLLMNRTEIDFPFFFLWSAQVLEADFDMVQDQPCHMAITPEIFVTQVVRDLVKHLVDKYGSAKEWQVFLVNNKYTEYCLYWIWLLMQNKHNELYDTITQKQLYGYATTGMEHDMSTQVKLSFQENANHYFSFVQSSLPISVTDIKQAVISQLQ